MATRHRPISGRHRAGQSGGLADRREPTGRCFVSEQTPLKIVDYSEKNGAEIRKSPASERDRRGAVLTGSRLAGLVLSPCCWHRSARACSPRRLITLAPPQDLLSRLQRAGRLPHRHSGRTCAAHRGLAGMAASGGYRAGLGPGGRSYAAWPCGRVFPCWRICPCRISD